LPNGVTFNPATGVLAGTPDAGNVGTYNLTFKAQNGIASDAVQNFTLSVVPPPAISNFTPGLATIILGSSTTLTGVYSNGTGSVDNGVGAVISATPVTVIPAATTTYKLTVTNAAGTSVAATTTVTVNNPVPTITSVSPTHANAGAAIATLTVNGSNFVPSSVINFNGKAENTVFVSSTQLTANVPAADNAAGGSVQVTVTSPGPGGGTTPGQTFTADSFTESIPAATATVSAGQPAQYTIMIAPSANGFTNTVTLAASGLPQGVSVTFSQNPAPAGNSVTMTLTTTARSLLPAFWRTSPKARGVHLWTKIFVVFIAILALIPLCRRRQWIQIVPFCSLLLCLFIAYGCATGGGNSDTSGGGTSGTPAGTYTITISLTSGTLVESTHVTLTVN
jgi:Putative Ig domain